MCKWGTETEVNVKISSDLSASGREKWRPFKIDTCIAPLVEALQKGEIDMRGSCCGHDMKNGWIELQDGRLLLIVGTKYADYFWRTPAFFYIRSLWRYVWYSVKNQWKELADILKEKGDDQSIQNR